MVNSKFEERGHSYVHMLHPLCQGEKNVFKFICSFDNVDNSVPFLTSLYIKVLPSSRNSRSRAALHFMCREGVGEGFFSRVAYLLELPSCP
jgi:hypothetical protein